MQKITQKAISLILSFMIALNVFSIGTIGAWAAEGEQDSGRTVLWLDSGNIVFTGAGCSVNGTPVEVNPKGYVITQHTSETLTNTVSVSGSNQDIILRNVNIKPDNGTSPFSISGVSVNLTLSGTNILDNSNSSINKCAGLSVNPGASVTISGEGSLHAQGSIHSAGIGGDYNKSCGDVTVNGGAIITKGNGAAGIGGGYGATYGNGNGGTVTISGGTVMATGSGGAAGIGGGYCGNSGTIAIRGGTVFATGSGGGAGIGGGNSGAGTGITISGGMVTATSSGTGAAIGGGDSGGSSLYGSGGTVEISGPDTQVVAQSKNNEKDIGGGDGSTGGSLTVSDGATVALLGSGTTVNAPSYADCRIIKNSGGSQTEKVYSVSELSAEVIPSSLTAEPAADGAVKLTASVTPAETGTFTFSFSGAKDSGIIAENVEIKDPGKASFTWKDAPKSGLTVITAKYKDTTGHFDALKPVLYYSPDAINISKVNSDGFGYTFTNTGSGIDIRLAENGWYVFTGSTDVNRIKVPGGVSASVTLKDVTVDVLGADYSSAFSLDPSASVNLTLEGTNILKSGMNRAGLEVPVDFLNPTDSTKNASLTVTAQSTGSLSAAGGQYGAGIGGGNNTPGGNIEISGGEITANGGEDASGIGGGAGGAGGTVAVRGKGTKVHAKGLNTFAVGSGIGANVNSGGTLTVGEANVSDGPEVELQSVGTNAVSTCKNCKIWGAGAADTQGQYISGYYDTNGKIRLSISLLAVPNTPSAAGNKVALTANISKYGFPDSVTPAGKVSFFCDGNSAGNPVTVLNGTAAADWTPADTQEHHLTAKYTNTGSEDLYATTTSAETSYSAGKATPAVTAPTADIAYGSKLSAAVLSGGSASGIGGAAVSGNFSWVNPAKIVTTSGSCQAVFTPDDSANYNAAFVMIPVAVHKATPTVQVPPTASAVSSGSPLSSSILTGGKAVDAGGTEVSGIFSWANPAQVVTTSGSWQAVFTPANPIWYNTAAITVMVPVTSAEESRHSSDTFTLPSSITDIQTMINYDLTGINLPSGVTGLSVGAVQKSVSDTSDKQAANVYHDILSGTGYNVIGMPVVFSLKLLDQNGNPVTGFTGEVKVKVPVPAGIYGTPRVFCYEENTGTLTDMNAAVENGFLAFKTGRFGYYAIAGTGNSITLDTKRYQISVGGHYQVGVKLTGRGAATVKFHSTNDKIATAAKLKNGNYQVTAKGGGTAYIMFDVYDNKNKLLTHASVRIDVRTGIRPRGDSTRQIGVF